RETNGPSIRSKEKNNFWINHLFGRLICGLSEKKFFPFLLKEKKEPKKSSRLTFFSYSLPSLR
ncbi:hypothetical protein, partial [Bacteroides sp.]|uniref:hypothetical protein n=1 Tax=Bacteroides sp. TaxID=29523 RepID=UPI0025878AD0